MALSEQNTVNEQDTAAPVRAAPARREIIYRHTIVVRVTHWINLLCLTLLLMSGLALFNVHPALYWGNYGYRGAPSFISISGMFDPETARPVGVTRIGDYSFDTTGILGVTYDSNGRPRPGAFPQWATGGLGLALARDWHFLAAWLFVINGAIYLLFEAAKRYNVLQKLTYLVLIFALLPAMLLTGLTMSPAATAAFPFLFDLFGGRQSARTIHFITANLLLLFVLVHVTEVLLSGVFNLMRSMITGRYVVKPERAS